MDARRWGLVAVVLLAVALRVGAMDRPGLWADEAFSLAIATGHSVEHPADQAHPDLGDFVESPVPRSAEELMRSTRQEDPPAGSARVLRAVLLSDTSPPLYYLVLDGWTRVFGTGDVALRSLSVLCALAGLPLLAGLASRVGGPRAVLPTLFLFAISPMSLHYSVEGRMYSMTWLWVLLHASASLRLSERGATAANGALWVGSAVGALLTHYFAVFPVAACGAWLMLHPGRVSRKALVGGAGAIVVVLAPWYRLVPESLAQWRITQDWLLGRPGWGELLLAPVSLTWNLLRSRVGFLPLNPADGLIAVALLGLLVHTLRDPRSRAPSPGVRLLLLWLLAAGLGPLVFDLLRGTATTRIPRYAVAGLPAALLLLGVAVGRLRGGGAMLVTWLLFTGWLPGIQDQFLDRARAFAPNRSIAERLDAELGPDDLILLHSIPTGGLALVRYLDGETPIAFWVEQLGERALPQDGERLIAGRRRVAHVDIHAVGAPAPERDWLLERGRLLSDERDQSARIVIVQIPERAIPSAPATP